MIFEVIRLVCIALFTAAIPLLVGARYKSRRLSAWWLIGLATALGGVLPYVHVKLLEPMHEAFDLKQMKANNECVSHPPPSHQNSDGSFDMGCSIGMGDWLPEIYHPVESLLYGPVYLLACWLAASLFLGVAQRWKRRVLLLVWAAILLTGWAVVFTYPIQPPPIFSDNVLIYGWNPFFGPQLFLPAALVAAWILVAGLPSTLYAMFRRRQA